MMGTKEILTIQFGHYANHVGSHWWNLQETNFSYDPQNPSEINVDILYREGKDKENKFTFTPRLLMVDARGALGSLRVDEEKLLDNLQEKSAELLWQPDLVKKVELPVLNDFENDETKEMEAEEINDFDPWIQNLFPRFHPRSINIIQNIELKQISKDFNFFSQGENLWKTPQFSDEFSDKIRMYVEECNNMQGFQVLMDFNNGFSGLGSVCIQHIHDEYGKNILTFPVKSSKVDNLSHQSFIETINTALCFNHIWENSSLFSPLCCGGNSWPTVNKPRSFEYLNYESGVDYQSSAILAAAIDTMTSRYRNRNFPYSMLTDLCVDLNKLGRKAAAASITMPFPMVNRKYLIDVLSERSDSSFWTNLTPNCDLGTERIMQSMCLKGVSEARLKKPLKDAKDQIQNPAYKCRSVHEMMTVFLYENCYASATHLTTLQKPLKINEYFPKIFDDCLGRDGSILEFYDDSNGPRSLPIMAGLHSGAYMSKMFESLHDNLENIKKNGKLHIYKDAELSIDDFKQCLNSLLDCKEAYEENYF